MQDYFLSHALACADEVLSTLLNTTWSHARSQRSVHNDCPSLLGWGCCSPHPTKRNPALWSAGQCGENALLGQLELVVFLVFLGRFPFVTRALTRSTRALTGGKLLGPLPLPMGLTRHLARGKLLGSLPLLTGLTRALARSTRAFARGLLIQNLIKSVRWEGFHISECRVRWLDWIILRPFFKSFRFR